MLTQGDYKYSHKLTQCTLWSNRKQLSGNNYEGDKRSRWVWTKRNTNITPRYINDKRVKSTLQWTQAPKKLSINDPPFVEHNYTLRGG